MEGEMRAEVKSSRREVIGIAKYSVEVGGQVPAFWLRGPPWLVGGR